MTAFPPARWDSTSCVSSLQEGFAPPEDEDVDEGAQGDQEEFWTLPSRSHHLHPARALPPLRRSSLTSFNPPDLDFS